MRGSSIFAQLLGVTVRPTRAFASITSPARRMRFVAACMVVLVGTLVINAIAVRPAQLRASAAEMRVAQAELEASIDPAAVNAETYAGSMDTLRQAAFVVGVIFRVIGLIGGLLLAAGALLLVVRLMRGSADYRGMLVVVCASWLPFACRWVVQAISVGMGGAYSRFGGLSTMVLGPTQVVGMPGGPHPLALAVLASIDVFVVWHAVVLVMGVRSVADLGPKRAIGIASLGWLGRVGLALVPILTATAALTDLARR